MKFLSIILACIAGGCLAMFLPGASAPVSISPRITLGTTAAQMQGIIDAAAKSGEPVTIDAGTYAVNRTITLQPGARIDGYGATLKATKAIPIFDVSAGYVDVEGVTFDASVDGATAIHGWLLRSTFEKCSFWTDLSYGIDGAGQWTFIEKCNFGLAGPRRAGFEAIRLTSQTLTNNGIFIDGCHVYTCGGAHAIEIAGGSDVRIERTNVETNSTTGSPIQLKGILQATIQGCWIEGNVGAAQIELVMDDAHQEGSRSITLRENTFMLSDPSNKTVVSVGAACGVNLIGNSGNLRGNPACDNPSAVMSKAGNFLIGEKTP